MAAATRSIAPNPRDIARAVEDLRAPWHALHMAASGISASLAADAADTNGVYFLLSAVASQFDQVIARLEYLMEPQS